METLEPQKRSSSRKPGFSKEQIWVESLRKVIRLEAQALARLEDDVDESFVAALEVLVACKGKVVLSGVGKSGLIARKIAATLNSTGTQATFLHPSDALHGDLGILSAEDVVIAIGKSGESEELNQVLPALRDLGPKLIAITANKKSTMARLSDVVLVSPIEKEACPLDLAPTVSTTVSLAIGDALAMTLMQIKNFKPEDFAKYHPGGRLGRRLLLQVRDLMIEKKDCPCLKENDASFASVLSALGEYGLGVVIFSSNGDQLDGILTDGDIRRLVREHGEAVFEVKISDVINRNPTTLSSQTKAMQALQVMEDHAPPLNVVPIVEEGVWKGIARLHDFLKLT